MNDVIDEKKELKAKHPKVLVLKWENHKRRITLGTNHDNNIDLPLPPRSEAPLQEPKERPIADAKDMEEKEKKNKMVSEENRKQINNVNDDRKRNLRLRTKKKKNEPLLKLEVSLSKSEIQEDFLKMIGKKPPSRPMKRSRHVQQDVINTTYLGLNLAEIFNDRYNVPEPPQCTRKPNE